MGCSCFLRWIDKEGCQMCCAVAEGNTEPSFQMSRGLATHPRSTTSRYRCKGLQHSEQGPGLCGHNLWKEAIEVLGGCTAT